MSVLEPIFALEGPLAQAVEGFRVRPQQLEMAQRIALAIAGNAACESDRACLYPTHFLWLLKPI